MNILNNFFLKKIIYWIKNKIFFFRLKNFMLRIFAIYFEVPLIYLFSKNKLNSFTSRFEDFRNNKNSIFIQKKTINRILNFYHKNDIKISQSNNKGVWKEWLDINFKGLINHLINKRIYKLTDLSNNMFREKIAIGAGGYDLWNRYQRIFGKYYINIVWWQYFKILKNSNYPMDKLKFPLIGNPCGLLYNGSVIPTETLRHAYAAQKILKYIDKENSLIVDIGSGIGGVVYQLLNLKKNTKVFLVDLPEMIFFSSAFITTAFPNKNFYFYGESEEIKKKADIFFIPNNKKNFLKEYSIDIYFNSCSFSEMDSKETRDYLNIINANCRGYLIHDNHDEKFRYKGNENLSNNIIGSEIGEFLNEFELLEKKIRKHKLPDDLNIKHFEYVFKKVKT